MSSPSPQAFAAGTQSPTSNSTLPPELTSPDVPAEDTRRFARRECKLPARMRVLKAWEPGFGEVRDFNVMVRNISRTGACFLYFKQLYPDDRIMLDFGELQRHYRIARCRRIAQNAYEIGAAVCAAPE
jgi:hypothetical protein